MRYFSKTALSENYGGNTLRGSHVLGNFYFYSEQENMFTFSSFWQRMASVPHPAYQLDFQLTIIMLVVCLKWILISFQLDINLEIYYSDLL